MAARRRVPTQERAQATQDAVIDGAAQVFDRSGYGDTSLSMIAEASGISQGAIYFHFKSKEQIALAVINAQHGRSMPLIDEIVDQYTGLLERLIRVSRGMAEQLRDDPVVRAGIRLALEDGALSEPAASFYEAWIDGTSRLLEPGLRDGEIVSSLSPLALARTLIGFFTGVQITSQATTGRSDLFLAVTNLWILVIDAIVPAASKEHVLAILSEVFPETARN